MPEPPPFDLPEGDDWLVLTDAELPKITALDWVEGERWGGVVGFFGVVRDHAEGRTDVLAVDYEAYEEQVLPRLSELAAAARVKVPGLGRIVVWHRTGHLVVGEASVAVVVSAPHRGEAFEACRFLIDTLKATVPIWKLEHWAGGSDWSPSANAVEEIGNGGRP
jgi:molybdopterin synthase catalytic subunit